VRDRAAAQLWYKSVLGLEPVVDLLAWARDGGPLTLANPEGNIHLALFESDQVQNTTVAFDVSGNGFFQWLDHLQELGFELSIINHDLSWSIYIKDPDGNPFEITTYDYAYVRDQLSLF
jgi:catechol 2,3-dioxygenase-like lactoylglutathione lyase family enzyme